MKYAAGGAVVGAAGAGAAMYYLNNDSNEPTYVINNYDNSQGPENITYTQYNQYEGDYIDNGDYRYDSDGDRQYSPNSPDDDNRYYDNDQGQYANDTNYGNQYDNDQVDTSYDATRYEQPSDQQDYSDGNNNGGDSGNDDCCGCDNCCECDNCCDCDGCCGCCGDDNGKDGGGGCVVM